MMIVSCDFGKLNMYRRLGSRLLSYGAAGISSNDIFGTSATSSVISDDLKDIMADVAENEELKRMSGNNRGFCQPDFLAKAELSHMESPEIDQKQEAKINKQAADLFSRLPTPADPMKAALRPTRDEIEAQEKFEVYKEAVREKYHARQRKHSRESARIEKAMEEVENGTYKINRESIDDEVGGYKPYKPVFDPASEEERAAEAAEKASLVDELAAAKAKLAQLEALLAKQSQH